jgi:orotate phosphoribosyltransferase
MPGLFDRDRLISLLKRDALRFGQFLLASGKTSHYYVDGRRVTLSAEGARVIGEGVIDILHSRPEIQAIGGLTMGADPIVGAVLALAPAREREALRGFLVRKETKAHGTGRLIEGPLEPGMTVAIVDDVATTGGSSLKAVEAVEAIGCTVACVIAVLDRLEGAGETFRARGLDFFALATVDELGVNDPVEPEMTDLPRVVG